METVFLKALNLALDAGWLILAVILLRAVFRRTPRRFVCLMWGLAAFKLVCPFSLKGTLSLIPSAEPVPQDIAMMQTPAIDSGIRFVDEAVNPVVQQYLTPEPAASANPLQILLPMAAAVWLLGTALMLLYAAVSYARLYRRTRVSLCVRDNIYVCDGIGTPFLLGFIRPRIFLPSGLSEERLEYVLEHERAHLSRGDHWWKPLGFLILSVYWFDPLCHIAYILFCRDMELAADERVIRGRTGAYRKAYSEALLSLSVPGLKSAACPLAFGEIGVKARIRSVLHYKKPALPILLAAAAAALLAVLCFFMDPVGEETQPAAESEEMPAAEAVLDAEEVPDTDTEQEKPQEEIDVVERFLEVDWDTVASLPFTGEIDFSGITCLGELPQYGIRVYGYNDEDIKGRGVAIDINGDVNYFDWFYTSSQGLLRDIYWDAEKRQLQTAFPVYTGTGVSAEILYISQYYDTGTLQPVEFAMEDYRAAAEERIGWRMDEAAGELVLFDRTSGAEFSRTAVPEGTVTDVDLVSISDFLLGDTVTLYFSPGYRTEDGAVCEYENMPAFAAEVVITGDDGYGSFELGLGEITEI